MSFGSTLLFHPSRLFLSRLIPPSPSFFGRLVQVDPFFLFFHKNSSKSNELHYALFLQDKLGYLPSQRLVSFKFKQVSHDFFQKLVGFYTYHLLSRNFLIFFLFFSFFSFFLSFYIAFIFFF